ncbi:MAG TPA: hypothetical protein VIW03_19010 [Anaeromyxobacter sp.]
MIPKLFLSLAAVLALSASAARADSPGGACSCDFDVTRAIEPAPGGCATAVWRGGGYDAIAEKPLLAADDPAASLAEVSPAQPSPLVAMVWMGP